MGIDYVKVSKNLIKYYKCEKIWFDFTGNGNDIATIYKVNFKDEKISRGLTSYSYEELQTISEM